MSLIPYTNFLPEIAPYVRDCPQDVLVNAIRNICIDFCNQTHWLQVTPDPQNVIADQDTYDLDYDTGTEPVRLIWTKISGTYVDAVLNRDFTITLKQVPSSTLATALETQFAVKPTRGSQTVDDTLFNRWVIGISYGVRARLYDIPAQPFSDAESAARAMAMYRSYIADAKADVNRALTSRPLVVAMRGGNP